MSNIESLIESLRHSPLLPEAVELLSQQLANEALRRQKFYQEMTQEQKTEFIGGDVVLHSPARNQHLDVTKYILKLLDTFVSLHDLGTVKAEKCLCVFPRNDYEPDVVFFGGEKAAELSPDTLRFPVPDLVVEVLSESTAARDRGVKFEDYAANAVQEYWIVDADRSHVEQYLLHDPEYNLELKSSTGIIRSQAIVGFEVAVEALFQEAGNLQALQAIIRSSTAS